MVSFPGGADVKWLKVDGFSWFSTLLCTNNHSVAPGNELTHRNWFDYPKLHVCPDQLLPHLANVLVLEWENGSASSAIMSLTGCSVIMAMLGVHQCTVFVIVQ